jgi:Domain of unknown function (DUF4440)
MMNHKILFPLAFFASVLLPIRAISQTPTPESLLNISNGTYTAFQEKDGKKMRTLTTSDFTYVGSEGVLSGEELDETTKSCTLRSFKLTSPQMRILAPTSATLSYTSSQDESCAGKPVPSVLLNVDVFVLRRGQWLVSTHMEVAAAGSKK